MKSLTVWRGHSTRPSLPAGTARKVSGHLSGRRPLHLANARPFGRSKAPLGLLLLRKRELALAGRTGPSCKQRKTGSSHWGTPCCTYRYRLWLLAGCVLFRGAPCFCFYGNSCCSICNERVTSANAQCSGLIQNPPCKSCTDLAVLRPIGAFPPAQQCIL